MGQNSVVLVRNYQDKRGTSSGLVMSRGNRYKLTVQAITFRIPKVLLWVTFRRKPRTMTVIAYNKLGEQPTGLQQFMHIQDPELRDTLENDWRELNDYLGMACWQMDNNRPLWRQVHEEISPQALWTLSESPWFSGKKLQKTVSVKVCGHTISLSDAVAVNMLQCCCHGKMKRMTILPVTCLNGFRRIKSASCSDRAKTQNSIRLTRSMPCICSRRW